MGYLQRLVEETLNEMGRRRYGSDPNRDLKRRGSVDFDGEEFQHKKMDDDVYQLRREAITHIYHLNSILETTFKKRLPRIDVRITDSPIKDILAIAHLGRNFIWIPEDTIKEKSALLKYIVYHEIGHAVFSWLHDKKSKLMSESVPMFFPNDNEIDKIMIDEIMKNEGEDLLQTREKKDYGRRVRKKRY